jgi:hypothetical protein
VLLVAPDVARVFILRDEPCPKAGGNETAERLMPPVASVPLSKARASRAGQKKRTPGDTSAIAIQRNGRCMPMRAAEFSEQTSRCTQSMSAFGSKADITQTSENVCF